MKRDNTSSALSSTTSYPTSPNSPEHQNDTFPLKNDISFKNIEAKYPIKISQENILEKSGSKNSCQNLPSKYLCKLAFDVNLFFGNRVQCLNKMSSENPLEKEIVSLIKMGLENYVVLNIISQQDMVERISESLKNVGLIPNFKVELVKDSEEERLVREVLEEPLDPTLVRVNIFYDLPGQLDQITLQVPYELFLHHKDEKP